MKKKLSLSNLNKDAICKEEQKQVSGGTVRAECWTVYVNHNKTGNEQYYNHCCAPFGSGDYWQAVWEGMLQ